MKVPHVTSLFGIPFGYCPPLYKPLSRLAALPACLSLAALQGCTALTGLDAASSFSCPAEPGVACSSLSATYEASEAGALPYQQRESAKKDKSEEREARVDETTTERQAFPQDASGVVRTGFAESLSRAAAPAPISNVSSPADPKAIPSSEPGISHPAATPQTLADAALPRRMPELLLRIWIAPWTDIDGDLHDASCVYARIREARWATAARRQADPGPALVPLPFGQSQGSQNSSPADNRNPEARGPKSQQSETSLNAANGSRFGDGASALEAAKAQVLGNLREVMR